MAEQNEGGYVGNELHIHRCWGKDAALCGTDTDPLRHTILESF